MPETPIDAAELAALDAECNSVARIEHSYNRRIDAYPRLAVTIRQLRDERGRQTKEAESLAATISHLEAENARITAHLQAIREVRVKRPDVWWSPDDFVRHVNELHAAIDHAPKEAT